MSHCFSSAPRASLSRDSAANFTYESYDALMQVAKGKLALFDVLKSVTTAAHMNKISKTVLKKTLVRFAFVGECDQWKKTRINHVFKEFQFVCPLPAI